MGSHQIWPGPECLKTKPWPRRGERVVLLDRRGEAIHVAPVLAVGQHFVEVTGPTGGRWLQEPTRVVPERAYGIALAHAKARARRDRCAGWLEQRGRHDAARVVRWSLSPEDAALWSAERHSPWAFAIAGSFWLIAYMNTTYDSDVPVLLARCLASPEWASLPWQADPEVARG